MKPVKTFDERFDDRFDERLKSEAATWRAGSESEAASSEGKPC